MNVIDHAQSEEPPAQIMSKEPKPYSFADRHEKDFKKQQKNIQVSKIEQLKFKMKMQNQNLKTLTNHAAAMADGRM